MEKKIERYLGVDWGEKRIGLATADGEMKLALPFKTVANVSELIQVIIEEEIELVVLGYPKKMAGAIANNPQWLDFVARLEKEVDCPLVFFDERLSSRAADSLGTGLKPVPGMRGKKPQNKAERDEVAAAIILQDYLDSLPA